MRALILTSALVAVASGNTCTDCTAVVNAIVEASISDESINTQQVLIFLRLIENENYFQKELVQIQFSKGYLGGSSVPRSRRSGSV